MLATVFATAFQCQPISVAWDGTSPKNTDVCLNRPVMFAGTGIADAVLNLAILILPILQVLRLDLGLSGWLSVVQVYVVGIL